MSLLLPHEHMLGRVAQALDADLRAEIAFVGGCVTALHITDPVTRSAVRLTDDVDAILHVMGKGPWYQLMERLQRLGFRISPEDDITCRTRLRDGEGPELIVDFMPDDPAILGFSNRWYPNALKTALPYLLPNGLEIRVVDPPHFVGTKLEAFQGRGNDDLLGSRDIEDLLNIVDGRERKDFKILLQAPHHSLEDYRFVMIGLNPIVQRRMLDAVKANGSRTSHRAQKMRRNETAKISSDLPDARHGPDR